MRFSIKSILSVTILCSFIMGCQSNRNIELTWTKKPDSKWSDQNRDVAMKSYLYAQMSNNTYGQAGDEYDSDGYDFVLPDEWSVEHFANNDLGFAYSIFRKYKHEDLQEVVIAFRGTEGLTNFDDVYHGNLLARQNPLAIKLYTKVRTELDDSGKKAVPIILTGHSLGGALAIHTAINVPNEVPYYVFNSSPRFKKLGDDQGGASDNLVNKRYSVVETNEFLYALRFAGREADQTYTTYNCDKYFKPFSSHGIEKLAKCLTQIAALNITEAKVEMVKKNSTEALAYTAK